MQEQLDTLKQRAFEMGVNHPQYKAIQSLITKLHTSIATKNK